MVGWVGVVRGGRVGVRVVAGAIENKAISASNLDEVEVSNVFQGRLF